MGKRSIAVALLAVAAGCATAPDAPSGENGGEWAAHYAADVEHIRRVIEENHPAVVDPEDPDFSARLRDAHAAARAFTPRVRSHAAYRIALSRFVSRFHDPHLDVEFAEPFEHATSTGIVARYHLGSFYAGRIDHRYSESGARFLGGRIVSCDGVPVTNLFAERVLAWRGRQESEADWIRFAPLLLYDLGSPTPPIPERCTIALASGEEELPLYWTQSTADELLRLSRDRESRPDSEPALERDIGRRLSWLSLPSFDVGEPGEVAAMQRLITQARATLASGRWRVLVIDLRGNEGGSPVWGEQLAAALFGDEWAAAAREHVSDGVYHEWRASAANAAAFRRRSGPQAERDHQIAATIEAARARGVRLAGTPRTPNGVPAPEPQRQTDPVVILTSASCRDACLDFLDLMRLRPEVTLLGQITSADSLYMEPATSPLPSGRGTLSYPMSVVRNRRRPPDTPHRPDRLWDADIADTERLRQWITSYYDEP